MRLLHTSDWHLGVSERTHSLEDDQKFFIDQICKIIESEEIDVVLLAGDVYDRSVPAADAIKLFDYAMTQICMKLQRQVICIAGNHDSSDRLASCSNLLKEAGLHVAGAIEKEPVIVEYEDTDIYMLPWFSEEKVRTLFPEEKDQIRSMEDAYRLVCDKCRESFKEGKKHIAVAHAFITSAETSTSDRAAEIGFATQVGASVFEGFDYVALGHIHKPQNINDRIIYSGTPMPYSFGKEEEQRKRVVIIDTESMERKDVPLELLNKRSSIEGTLEDILNPESYLDIRKYKTAKSVEDIVDGYVRVKVTDKHVDIEQIARIRSVYPKALDISGKSYDSEDAGIRMSMEEFRELENSPEEIFHRFCRDIIGSEADEHKQELFMNCLRECNNETD